MDITNNKISSTRVQTITMKNKAQSICVIHSSRAHQDGNLGLN